MRSSHIVLPGWLRALVVVAVGVASIAGLIALSRGRVPPGAAPPVVVDRCAGCHAATEGLGPAHAAVGCSACHQGDPTARDAEGAHRGLELLAGDLATIDRTCGVCHPAETARVRGSAMARVPGILGVDAFAFGERASPDADAALDVAALDPDRLPASPAEAHVRQLCASCHLGARKPRPGDLGDAARGGGCTACHLAPPYAGRRRGGGPLHPDVTAAVSERRCAGCHGRSGRIALSYRGVVELEPGDPRVTGALADGRPVGRAPADVHARAGMTCIDCHTERELMGDGRAHRHAREALDVACDDCHGAARLTADPDRDAVADRLRASWARRGLPALPSGPPLRTRAGTPLWRTDARAGELALVETGVRLAIPRATDAPYHALAGHARLACQACHAGWAPRCRACHTSFDPAGEAVDLLSGRAVVGAWVERAGGNGYGAPLLAVGVTGRIEPFVEGMALVVDGAAAGHVERTLFAPLDPHTTGPARGCASCHAPADLDDVYPPRGETTRGAARLLDAAERARIARVGRCVACHARYDDPVYADFAASVARLAARRDPQVARCRGEQVR